jgi:hypothetical protein
MKNSTHAVSGTASLLLGVLVSAAAAPVPADQPAAAPASGATNE